MAVYRKGKLVVYANSDAEANKKFSDVENQRVKAKSSGGSSAVSTDVVRLTKADDQRMQQEAQARDIKNYQANQGIAIQEVEPSYTNPLPNFRKDIQAKENVYKVLEQDRQQSIVRDYSRDIVGNTYVSDTSQNLFKPNLRPLYKDELSKSSSSSQTDYSTYRDTTLTPKLKVFQINDGSSKAPRDFTLVGVNDLGISGFGQMEVVQKKKQERDYYNYLFSPKPNKQDFEMTIKERQDLRLQRKQEQNNLMVSNTVTGLNRYFINPKNLDIQNRKDKFNEFTFRTLKGVSSPFITTGVMTARGGYKATAYDLKAGYLFGKDLASGNVRLEKFNLNSKYFKSIILPVASEKTRKELTKNRLLSDPDIQVAGFVGVTTVTLGKLNLVSPLASELVGTGMGGYFSFKAVKEFKRNPTPENLGGFLAMAVPTTFGATRSLNPKARAFETINKEIINIDKAKTPLLLEIENIREGQYRDNIYYQGAKQKKSFLNPSSDILIGSGETKKVSVFSGNMDNTVTTSFTLKKNKLFGKSASVHIVEDLNTGEISKYSLYGGKTVKVENIQGKIQPLPKVTRETIFKNENEINTGKKAVRVEESITAFNVDLSKGFLRGYDKSLIRQEARVKKPLRDLSYGINLKEGEITNPLISKKTYKTGIRFTKSNKLDIRKDIISNTLIEGKQRTRMSPLRLLHSNLYKGKTLFTQTADNRYLGYYLEEPITTTKGFKFSDSIAISNKYFKDLNRVESINKQGKTLSKNYLTKLVNKYHPDMGRLQIEFNKGTFGKYDINTNSLMGNIKERRLIFANKFLNYEIESVARHELLHKYRPDLTTGDKKITKAEYKTVTTYTPKSKPHEVAVRRLQYSGKDFVVPETVLRPIRTSITRQARIKDTTQQTSNVVAYYSNVDISVPKLEKEFKIINKPSNTVLNNQNQVMNVNSNNGLLLEQQIQFVDIPIQKAKSTLPKQTAQLGKSFNTAVSLPKQNQASVPIFNYNMQPSQRRVTYSNQNYFTVPKFSLSQNKRTDRFSLQSGNIMQDLSMGRSMKSTQDTKAVQVNKQDNILSSVSVSKQINIPKQIQVPVQIKVSENIFQPLSTKQTSKSKTTITLNPIYIMKKQNFFTPTRKGRSSKIKYKTSRTKKSSFKGFYVPDITSMIFNIKGKQPKNIMGNYTIALRPIKA